MNKKILALAIAAVALMATSVSARENRGHRHNTNCNNTECPVGQRDKAYCKKDVCKNDSCPQKFCKQDRKNCDRRDCFRNGGKKCNPFEGLNLSQEQQTRIAAIPTPRQVMRAAVEKGEVKRENAREYMRTVRADYLNNVKQVLSTDQYNKFLENFYVNAGGNKNKKDGKFGKGQGKDKKQFKNKQNKGNKNKNSK